MREKREYLCTHEGLHACAHLSEMKRLSVHSIGSCRPYIVDEYYKLSLFLYVGINVNETQALLDFHIIGTQGRGVGFDSKKRDGDRRGYLGWIRKETKIL